MTDHEYTYHRAPNGDVYRIHLETDPNAASPRDDDYNVSTLVTWDRRWLSPDRDRATATDLPTELFNGDGNVARKLAKYVALYRPDVLVMVPLNRGGCDGTLETDPTDRRDNHDGIAYVTRADWEAAMGTDYTGDVTPTLAVEQEIAVYNRWAAGEYVGYVVERREPWTKTFASSRPDLAGWDWIITGDCWGIDDETYALREAIASLPTGAVEVTDAAEADPDAVDCAWIDSPTPALRARHAAYVASFEHGR